MQKHFFSWMMIISLFLFQLPLHAQSQNKNFSLELQNTPVGDVVRLLAKFLNMNVVISPAVTGVVSLHLAHAAPMEALDLLLTMQGLAKSSVGNVWFIAPRDELIKRQQDEIKWQEVRDESSPLVTDIWPVRYGNAQDIAQILQDEHAAFISKRGRVRVDKRTNIICVQDIPERIREIRRLLKVLDVPVQQIVIEARLASVDSDFERELGIRFAVQNSVNSQDPATQNLLIHQETGQYSLAVARLADGSLLDVKLAALERAGHAELLSRPSLFTANQETASIEAGEEVPYQEVSDSGGTAIAFKKAVLGLKVTPQALPGKKVLLRLQINQDRPSSRMVLGVPAISTRQVITHVLVENGQTVVLGGIYETNHENAEERVPFLNKIPVIGVLFKQTKIRENKRELLIFVTPKIIA